MKTVDGLMNISDGRLYDIRDMVKVDAGGCKGCSACCEGVGELVELTPFDLHEIKKYTDMTFDELLGKRIELMTYKKIVMPHLKMVDESDKCTFLDEKGRCSIHSARPNICRLFPLGRVYEEDDFKYFLQEGACTVKKLGKVKVKKWLGIQNYKENKGFILEWYKLKKALEFRLKFIRDEEELDQLNDYLLDAFFRTDFPDGIGFYSAFSKVLIEAKNRLGII